MTSGGARAWSGPPPDPNALRRAHDKADVVHLPAAGRTTPAPDWPLSRSSARERVLWEREWRRPQALMWEANGQFEEVALFVRTLAAAERPKATVGMRNLVKQQMEALGLSLPGMARLRWVIDDASAPTAAPKRKAASATARDRLEVIRGGA